MLTNKPPTHDGRISHFAKLRAVLVVQPCLIELSGKPKQLLASLFNKG